MFEHEQDKARARGERIHLIWSQLAAHAYRNGQWGARASVSLPSAFLSPLALSLGVPPPRRHEPGAGRSDGQA